MKVHGVFVDGARRDHHTQPRARLLVSDPAAATATATVAAAAAGGGGTDTGTTRGLPQHAVVAKAPRLIGRGWGLARIELQDRTGLTVATADVTATVA